MNSEEKGFKPAVHWDVTVQPYFKAAFGASGLDKLSEALCRPPLINSFRLNLDKTTREIALSRLSEATDSNEHAHANQWSGHLAVPDIISQKGTGPHVVHYENTAGQEVVISRRAAEAVLRGAHVFVPGVMACSQNLHEGDLVAVSIAMEAPGTNGYITRGSVVGSDLIAESALYIGKGIAKFSRQNMFKETSGIGVEMTDRVFRLQPCHGMLSGLGMLQNLPSAVVARVLAPVPGSKVLDMCASPGGKSTHAGQLMGDQGRVIALDRTHAKAQQIRNLAAELGLTCIEAFKMDATTALQKSGAQAPADVQPGLHVDAGQQHQSDAVPSMDTGSQALPNAKEQLRRERKDKARAMHGQAPLQRSDPSSQPVCKGFPPDSFEYILLDAPCSALGLRPRLSHHTTLLDLMQTARYQRNLLRVAVQLLKPGGHLVYSTCTINPGENEANVHFVLKTLDNMRLVAQQPYLASHGLTGQYTHEDGHREEWLTPEQASLVQRFDPCSKTDTIGFFIAKFCKVL
ncbi:hypothetical protein WJX82_010533 [Trebouxia sp. C0006]